MAGISFFSTKDQEWDDLDVYVSGVKVAKVTDFEAGVKTDKEYLHAAHVNPLSIQSGNKQYPFKITLLLEAVRSIWAAAVAAGGDDITDVAFDVAGVFRAQGARTMSTISVTGCEISEAMFKMAQNDKKMQVDLPGLAMAIAVV